MHNWKENKFRQDFERIFVKLVNEKKKMLPV